MLNCSSPQVNKAEYIAFITGLNNNPPQETRACNHLTELAETGAVTHTSGGMVILFQFNSVCMYAPETYRTSPLVRYFHFVNKETESKDISLSWISR